MNVKAFVYRVIGLMLMSFGILQPGAWAEDPAGLRGLKPLPIADVLRIVSTDPANDHPPSVRILLKNGREFTGVVSLYSPEKGTCAISKSGELTVVSLADVSAVTVLDAGSAAVELQGGKVFRPAADSGPSRLELERTAAALGKRSGVPVVVDVAPEQELTSDCRFAAGKMLTALDQALIQVTKDEMGARSLAGYPLGIILRHVSGAGVSAQPEKGRSMTIEFDCSQPLDGHYATEVADVLNRNL